MPTASGGSLYVLKVASLAHVSEQVVLDAYDGHFPPMTH